MRDETIQQQSNKEEKNNHNIRTYIRMSLNIWRAYTHITFIYRIRVSRKRKLRENSVKERKHQEQLRLRDELK